VLRIEVEPPHRLLEYTITVRAFDPAAETLGDIIVLQRYVVSEWREVEPGLWIPQVAELRGWRPTNPDPKGPAPLATHVRYERTGFTLIQDPSSVDAALFETPLPLGTSVHDQRFNLSFRIGDTSLSLDGVAYELDRPILQHPGDALAELIRSAPPRIPADTEASITPPATADGPARTSPSGTAASTPTSAAVIDDDPRAGAWPRRFLVIGLLAAACGCILIGVHRRRLASSHA